MRWGDGVTPGKGEAGENIVMVGIGEGDGLGDGDGYACATVRAGGPSVMVAEGLGTPEGAGSVVPVGSGDSEGNGEETPCAATSRVSSEIATTAAMAIATNHIFMRGLYPFCVTPPAAGYERRIGGTNMACKGEGCQCQASDGEYCSDACKTANDHGHCHCGHAACQM